MNTYIKQLIDAYGNNLIPVSGTASCYNSDGLTVDEIIENLKSSLQSVIPITWAGLKALKSSKLLSPGTIYCITDYKTVSTQSGTTTTGNGMQILVQALSKNTLSEDALGLLESGSGGGQDIYSGTVLVKKALMGDGSGGGSGKIEILDLKYSLENDTSKFSWSGNDESVPEIYTDDEMWFSVDGTMSIEGTTYYKWYSPGFGEDSRLLSTTLDLKVDDSMDYISDISDTSTYKSGYSTISQIRTSIKGYGVIYYMKDTNNNEAPYDFKNIIFSGHYTFDLSGTDYSSSSNCYENVIKTYKRPVAKVQELNNIVFLNTSDSDICKANYIEPDTHDISYGPGTSDLDTRLILGEY